MAADVGQSETSKSQRDEAEITTDLVGCARCWGDGHKGLTFKRLTHPFQPTDEPEPVFTHWAPCPTNGEPILMLTTATPDVIVVEAKIQLPQEGPDA